MRSTIQPATLTAIILILVGPLGPVHAQVFSHTPIDTYDIVTSTAVSILPPPLRSFFEDRLDTIHKIAETCGQPSEDSERSARTHLSHYVFLDAAAATKDWKMRLAAAHRFPHNRKQAGRMFDELGIDNMGGNLPWVILEHYDSLTQAFQTGELNKITRESGVLLHFVTDACWPFNTTVERVTSLHQIYSPSSDERSAQSFSSSLSTPHLTNVLLLRQLHERLAYEVRVTPKRYQSIADPADAVFNELLQSYKAIDDLREAAKYIQHRHHAAPVFEVRLEAAALLGANLIGTAWENANKPILNVKKEDRNKTVKKQLDRQPIALTEDVFVGSKHSGVFHRTFCQHAKRIKPDNVIRFTTLNQALQAGRKACRTCKPPEKSP